MRAKQNKKKLITALVGGALAGLFVLTSFNSQKTMIDTLNMQIQRQSSMIQDLRSNPVSNPTANSNVFVVAKIDIPAGTLLSNDNIDIQKDVQQPPAAGGYHDVATAVGQIASVALKAGEFITSDKIISSKFSSMDIPPGMRAITIPIDLIQGLASYITVGSRVDIIPIGKSGNNAFALQNVKIISLENPQDNLANTATNKASALTIQIPTEVVSKLVAALSVGKIQVIARPFTENSSKETKYITRSNSDGTSGNFKKPNIKFELPKLPGNISISPDKLSPAKLPSGLPEPAAPPGFSSGKKIELIQANVKTEVNFDK